jgi:carboxyl-terminal processing protease
MEPAPAEPHRGGPVNSLAVRTFLIAVIASLIGVLLVAVGFLARVVTEPEAETVVASTEVIATTESGEADFAVLDEIIRILEEDFVEPDRIDREFLFEGAINGIFTALGDPHSTYIDPTTYAISRDDFSGAFQGIGATVAQQDEFVVIVRTLPNTPAERSNLEAGDAILAVNGEDATGWTVDKAVLKIRGPRGTEVELTIRHLDGSEETLSIERDEIEVSSVDALPPGGVLRDANGDEVTEFAYFRIRSFTNRTPREIQNEVDAALETGATGLIIDVRGNPGGLLVETAQSADMFLDEGLIVTQVDRDGTERSIEARPGMVTDLPIVVVQDEFSASGSELLAAALQENGRATVVGARSFGKGTVNHARELSNGGAVYVSIARWLTPDRNLIEGDGVRPDIEVTLTADDIEQQRDVALYRAIDVLRAADVSVTAPSN